MALRDIARASGSAMTRMRINDVHCLLFNTLSIRQSDLDEMLDFFLAVEGEVTQEEYIAQICLFLEIIFPSDLRVNLDREMLKNEYVQLHLKNRLECE